MDQDLCKCDCAAPFRFVCRVQPIAYFYLRISYLYTGLKWLGSLTLFAEKVFES